MDSVQKCLSKGVILYGKSSDFNNELSLDVASTILCWHSEMKKEDVDRYVREKVHPNLFFVKKEVDRSDISVEQTRLVKDFFAHEPTLNSPRVALIESAEFFSNNAANSILKILEEVPQDSCILLTTKKLRSIVSTIRSRCYKIYVKSEHEDYAVKEFVEKLNSTEFDVINFSKEIIKSKDELDKFFKTAMAVSMNNLSNNVSNCTFAETYIEMDRFINLSKKTHIDPQIAVCLVCSMLLQ